jgi:hypothetical protein
MNTQTIPDIEPTELQKYLNSMESTIAQTMRCASICAAFISGAYLTATVEQLTAVIWDRHKKALEESFPDESPQHGHVATIVQDTVKWGLECNFFRNVGDGKIEPTEQGWFVGQDWEYRLRNGW